MQRLPFLPIYMPELLESDCFLHGDPRLVRAALHMQQAAWAATPPGSVPSSFEKLAEAARLTPAEVELHYSVLTQGWSLEDDGRLHHPRLGSLAAGLEDRFGAQLDVFAESAALACQGGDGVFELVSPEAAAKKAPKKGKRECPKDFSPDKASLASIIDAGFKTVEQREWLLTRFMDYVRSNATRQADWQATFRNFAGSRYTAQDFSVRFGHLPGDVTRTAVSTSSAAGRLRSAIGGERPTFAAQAAAKNSSAMAAAAERIFGAHQSA